MKKKNLLLEIIGNVASGKTTLCHKLAAETKFQYMDIDLFVKNPFLAKSADDRQRWIFTSHLFFSFDRSRQIGRVKKQLQKTPVILDAGFQMGFYVYTRNVYQQKYMTQEEFNLISALHHSLMQSAPVPDITIVLLPSFAEIKKRIVKRNRAHEKKYSDEYIKGLEYQLKLYLQELIKNQRNVLTIEDKNLTQYGKVNPKLISQLNKTFID